MQADKYTNLRHGLFRATMPFCPVGKQRKETMENDTLTGCSPERRVKKISGPETVSMLGTQGI